MATNLRRIIAMLEADGWFFYRQRGSHAQYKHPTKTGTVTVPAHGNIDIKPGTLSSIKRQAGLK